MEIASSPQHQSIIQIDASESQKPNGYMKPEPKFTHMTYNPYNGQYNWPKEQPEAPHNTSIVSITDTVIDITSTDE